MTKIIETQVMIHRTTDYTKDSSMQIHRTDVSQAAFTKEMKARAQRELHQTVGVTNVDGDIMIKEDQEPDRKKHARYPVKKCRGKTATASAEKTDNADKDAPTIDIRV